VVVSLILYGVSSVSAACMCTGPGGVCLPSVFGSACLECSYAGYVVQNGTCSCYAYDLNPFSSCQPLVSTFVASIPLVVEYSNVYCEPFSDFNLGMFGLTTFGTYQIYGDPNPPQPIDCLNPSIGPQTGQIVEVVTPNTVPTLCTEYGGIDPNSNSTQWTPCSSHGQWNTTSHQCLCNDQWSLWPQPDTGFQGEQIYSCSVCAPWWGPPPSSDILLGPFCSSIWTPSSSGVNDVCGGSGVMVLGVCSCDPGSTNHTITENFAVYTPSGMLVANNYTITTCFASEP
jgi:hypothetical protein